MSCPMFCTCEKCSSRIASEHRAGDERFGRDWRKGDGCGCGACRAERIKLDDIDASFARITELEQRLASVRAIKAALADNEPRGQS